MHITLIQPAVGRKADGSPYPASWRMEPLGIATLAGLTPPDVERTFFDDRFEPIDYGRPTDLACITVETYTARRSYQIAARYRQRGVPVVLGGFHPTLLPEESSRHADVLVTGEAEPVWERLLTDAAEGRLATRYQGQRPKLSGRSPDRSIFGRRNYGPLSLVETSRGCRFNCEFCTICQVYGHACEERPVDEVVAEVRALTKPVFFVDDNLGVRPERLAELCRALLPLKRRWVGQVSLQAASDSGLLRLMRRSGCQGVLIGFESLEEGNLEAMGKGVNRGGRDYERAIRTLRANGLAIYATFVFGYDHDTADTFRRVYEFAMRQRFFFTAFNHLVPFPGTPLHTRLSAEDRLLSPQWWLDPSVCFGDVVFRPAQLTPSELATLCAAYRRRFYRGRAILHRGCDLAANCRTPAKGLAFFAQNALHRREVARRQGLPMGVTENACA